MKAIRIIAIVLMGLTAAVNVLGGVGTSCAAFAPERWDSMRPLLSLQWLYQILVFTVAAVGIAGVWATLTLARAQRNSYVAALVVLMVGMILAMIQMAASRSLRGKSMPTDLRLYISVVTLLVLLILRLPGVWQKSGMGGVSGSGSWTTPAGMASIVMGLAVLTAPWWAGESHFLNGYNWVYVGEWQLLASGIGLLLGGIILLGSRRLTHRPARVLSPVAPTR